MTTDMVEPYTVPIPYSSVVNSLAKRGIVISDKHFWITLHITYAVEALKRLEMKGALEFIDEFSDKAKEKSLKMVHLLNNTTSLKKSLNFLAAVDSSCASLEE